MTAVLVLACSQKKRPDAGELPALERYDGPAFRVLRRQLRAAARRDPLRGDLLRGDLTVLVLSARFGLIEASRPIPDYDERMTATRAEELAAIVGRGLRDWLRVLPAERVGLCLGRIYRRALADVECDPPAGVEFEFLEGGLGRRLTALKAWLERESSRVER
jgi:hypothetical protein